MIAAMALLALGFLDDQQAKTFEKDVTVHVTVKYLLALPEGYDPAGDQRWPLVVFLHGAGESGDDLEKVKQHGPPKLLAKGKKIPAIVASPQSPKFGWDIAALKTLVDDLKSTYKVDPDRVYLTGLSMGGFGTWALGAASPDTFAALAPICGGGAMLDTWKLKGKPIWAFHGAKDNVVPLKSSEDMIEPLKKMGSPAKLTVYPEAGHDSWTETYDNPEFWEWLFAQKRGK